MVYFNLNNFGTTPSSVSYSVTNIDSEKAALISSGSYRNFNTIGYDDSYTPFDIGHTETLGHNGFKYTPYKGKMSKIQVYDKKLTYEEVNQIFKKTLSI